MALFENNPRITPFLWFDSNAEEAVEFYLTVFKNARRFGEVRDSGSPKPPALTVGLSWMDRSLLRSMAAHRSNSLRRFPLWCAANPRPKWMTTGRN